MLDISKPSNFLINRGSGPSAIYATYIFAPFTIIPIGFPLAATGYRSPYIANPKGGYAPQFVDMSPGYLLVNDLPYALQEVSLPLAGGGPVENYGIGVAPYTTIVISFWATLPKAVSTLIASYLNSAIYFGAEFYTSNTEAYAYCRSRLFNGACLSTTFSAAGTSFGIGSGALITVPTTPTHFLLVLDGASGTAYTVINGVPISNLPIDALGGSGNGLLWYDYTAGNPASPNVGVFYFGQALFADLFIWSGSQPINISNLISKFITPQGQPMYLGENGELPLGTKPYAFFSLGEFYTPPPPPIRVASLGGGRSGFGYNPGSENIPPANTTNAPLWGCCDLTGSYGCGNSLNVTGAGTR